MGGIIFHNVRICDGAQMRPGYGAVRVEGNCMTEVSSGSIARQQGDRVIERFLPGMALPLEDLVLT